MERKMKKFAWNEINMSSALQDVRKRKISINEASRRNKVPKTTLIRRLDGINKIAKEERMLVGSQSDIPPEMEEELCNHILELEARLYGITPYDVRKLAFEIAQMNKLKHRFNVEKKIAGKKWYYSFMKRHPHLSLRQPRATSFNRATGFNKSAVNDFFSKFLNCIDEHDINDPHRIFNVDETGISTVQNKPRSILALKGKQQVGVIASSERGTTSTAVCCFNAAGSYVPPLIIIKRKRGKEELKDGAPPGTIFAFNPESGYINKEIFLMWLKHFVAFAKPTPTKKIILILDGHTTHTKNLEAILFAKENNIIMLSLPAHTSHKLQPLDVSFFKPLKTFYTDEMEKWLRDHPGRTVTTFQISMLFGRAYSRAASIGTAVNGFLKTGIYPCNRNVFSDDEYAIGPEELENIPPKEIMGNKISQPAENTVTTNESRVLLSMY